MRQTVRGRSDPTASRRRALLPPATCSQQQQPAFEAPRVRERAARVLVPAHSEQRSACEPFSAAVGASRCSVLPGYQASSRDRRSVCVLPSSPVARFSKTSIRAFFSAANTRRSIGDGRRCASPHGPSNGPAHRAGTGDRGFRARTGRTGGFRLLSRIRTRRERPQHRRLALHRAPAVQGFGSVLGGGDRGDLRRPRRFDDLDLSGARLQGVDDAGVVAVYLRVAGLEVLAEAVVVVEPPEAGARQDEVGATASA